MRILVRLALLCAAVLSLTSVAVAGGLLGKADKPEKPGRTGDDEAGAKHLNKARTVTVRAGERHVARDRRG